MKILRSRYDTARRPLPDLCVGAGSCGGGGGAAVVLGPPPAAFENPEFLLAVLR